MTINYTLILELILISVFKINSKNLLSSTLLKIIMINSKINTLIRGGVFVVANSLDEKNKAASNDYNTRVVECRYSTEVEFVSAVSAGGSVKFLPAV